MGTPNSRTYKMALRLLGHSKIWDWESKRTGGQCRICIDGNRIPPDARSMQFCRGASREVRAWNLVRSEPGRTDLKRARILETSPGALGSAAESSSSVAGAVRIGLVGVAAAAASSTPCDNPQVKQPHVKTKRRACERALSLLGKTTLPSSFLSRTGQIL